MSFNSIVERLGAEATDLLNHTCNTIPKDRIQVPGSDFVDRVFARSDRNIQTLRSIQTLFDHGRLAGTGYLSILPVDQGIEHSGGTSFAKTDYFDQNIAENL